MDASVSQTNTAVPMITVQSFAQGPLPPGRRNGYTNNKASRARFYKYLESIIFKSAGRFSGREALLVGGGCLLRSSTEE